MSIRKQVRFVVFPERWVLRSSFKGRGHFWIASSVFWIDFIWMHNSRLLPLLFSLSVFSSLLASGELLTMGKRVLDPVVPSGITVELELFAELPHTSEVAPLTRINYMTPLLDGSGRLFVAELRGKIYEVSTGKVSLFMDYIAEVPELFHTRGFGTGLCSVAFHPDFKVNGKFYTAHTEQIPESEIPADVADFRRSWWKTGVVTEWVVEDPQADEFSGNRRELLRVNLPSHAHGFQEIAFNPNVKSGEPDFGLLYICLGESGSFQMDRTQYLRTLDSPLGCILRIDPAGKGSSLGDYGIPEDNPWANSDDSTVLGEIWAMGMRNPHRIHWDRGGSGRMFFGDIGELRIEELNIAEVGRDYGWPVREGRFRFDPHGERYEIFALTEEDEAEYPDLTYPVAQYEHADGMAVSGGGVYRGDLMPAMWGKYIMGDIAFGRLFFVIESELDFDKTAPVFEFQVSIDGTTQSLIDFVGGGRVDLRFGWDAEGELYLFEKGQGRIYKAVGASIAAGSEAIVGDYSKLTLNTYDVEVDPELAVVASLNVPMLDDMEDGDLKGLLVDGRDWDWFGYGERSGGKQTIEVVEDITAPGEGSRVLYVSDHEGKAVRGAGIVMPLVTNVEPATLRHLDASAFDGVQFWIKGVGVDEVTLNVSTPYIMPIEDGGLCNGKTSKCYRFYLEKVSVKAEWTLVKVRFEELQQVRIPNDGPFDSRILKDLALSFPSKTKYEIWIDDVSFFKDD